MSAQKAFISEALDGDQFRSTFAHPHSVKEIIGHLTPEEFQSCIELAASVLEYVKGCQLSELSKEEKKKQEGGIEQEIGSLAERLRNVPLTESEPKPSHSELCKSLLYKAIQPIVTQYEKQLTALEREVEKLEADHKKELAECRKQASSPRKGKKGEEDFASLAHKWIDGLKLEDVTRKALATDFKSVIRDCQVRFEIKNYSSNVPYKEVEKFQRDMKVHREAPLGVFVSMQKTIARNNSFFVSNQWSEASQLLLFIHSFNDHSAKDVFDTIDLFIDIAKQVKDYINKREKHGEMDMREKIKRDVDEEIKGLNLLYKNQEEDRKQASSPVPVNEEQNSSYTTEMESRGAKLKKVIAESIACNSFPSVSTASKTHPSDPEDSNTPDDIISRSQNETPALTGTSDTKGSRKQNAPRRKLSFSTPQTASTLSTGAAPKEANTEELTDASSTACSSKPPATSTIDGVPAAPLVDLSDTVDSNKQGVTEPLPSDRGTRAPLQQPTQKRK